MSILSKATLPCVAVALSSLVGQPAWAQRVVNRCTDAAGQTLLSDRPCVSASPAPTAAASADPGGRASPVRQRRLSPACTRLADAIDSAPLRRVRADALSSMRTEYAHSCEAEERR